MGNCIRSLCLVISGELLWWTMDGVWVLSLLGSSPYTDTLGEPKQKKTDAFLTGWADQHNRQHKGKDGCPNVYLPKRPRSLSKEGKDGGPNAYLLKGLLLKIHHMVCSAAPRVKC